MPDPEVPSKPKHRKFTGEYKRRILAEADACSPGELGALLRREGLYYTILEKWRKVREQGGATALDGRQRGRPVTRTPEVIRLEQLEKENKRLQMRLQQAELIIQIQKKVADMLGAPLDPTPPLDPDLENDDE